MAKLHKRGKLGSLDYEPYDTCESCLLRKMTKFTFKGKGERVSEPLDQIHTNVCVPMSTHDRGGFRWVSIQQYIKIAQWKKLNCN